MLESLRAAALGLILGALAANCAAQITPSNPGLKNWFSLQSWVSDIAGVQGMSGSNGNNIPALTALMQPMDVKTDRAGNVYIADFASQQIRMIQAGTSTIVAIAGSGGSACVDQSPVAPLSATLGLAGGLDAHGLAIDGAGNIYVSTNNEIKMLWADRTTMTTIAGNCAGGYNGSPYGVPANTALFREPAGIAVDSQGNVIVADSDNHLVRMISGGTVYDIANISHPTGVAIGPGGVIYVTDELDNRIWMIVDGTLYNIVGNGTIGNNCSSVGSVYPVAPSCMLNSPTGIAVNGHGDVVFLDSGNAQIKAIITDGTFGTEPSFTFLTALTPSSVPAGGYAGAPSNGRNFWSPLIDSPYGIDIDVNGRIRIADTFNNVVRLWRGESPLLVQTTDNTSAYEVFYQYDGVNTSYRYPNNTISLPPPRTLAIGGDPAELLVGSGDFNRDGNLDLVWEDQITHQVTIWYQTNAGEQGALGAAGSGYCPCTTGFQYVALTGSADWHVVAVADFNGDGVPDLVFQNTTTYQVVIWNMTGPQGNIPLSLTYTPGVDNAPWVVVGAADFNGDGTPDLLWQNPTTRQMLVWYMGAQGGSFTAYSVLDQALSGWTCIGTKDFDGNGKPDIFYQNDSTGEVMVWLMGGAGGQDSLNQVILEPSPPTNSRYIAR